MKMALIFMILISSTMILSSHPVSILFMILLQTLNSCFMIWMLTKTSWLPFILFIMFLGGLMVLFIYITSLASNEKFNISLNFFKPMTLILMTLMIFFPFLSKNFSYNEKMKFYEIISPILLNHNLMITAFIMTYLLIVLVIVIKISKKMEGPLRNMIFN